MTFSRFKFSLFLIFGLTGHLISQTFSNDLRLDANYHYGFILPEYNNLNYVVHSNVNSFEVSASKQTTGKNVWEKLYNYPSYGIRASYTTLGNSKVNGEEISLFPYAIFHYLKTKRFNIDQQIGIGFAYATKKFDLQTNYENIAVGSKVNLHFNMRFGFYYDITPRININSGVSFSHYSNGNLREPNLGLNFATLYGGFGYLIGEKSVRNTEPDEAFVKDHAFEFAYAIGGKHTRALQSSFYMTSSIAGEYKLHIKRAFKAGIGADLFYDSSTEIEMQLSNPIPYKSSYAFSSGIHISEELVYNRISIIIQEGVYVGLPEMIKGHRFYNRGMIKFQATKHLFVSFGMKTHLHILDHPEIGIGYKF